MTLRTIVAATDLSAPARHAAERAASLAAAHGARLTLAHAVEATALDDLRRWIGREDPGSALQASASEALHTLAAELQRRNGIEVSERLSCGNPVQEVSRLAEELDADLLVAGTRGAGFFRGVIVGSTAERVAKRSSRPVLMVRQSVHERYGRLLVPVDFSPWSLEGVALARRLAPDATLVLLHALEVPFEGKLRVAGVDDAAIRAYRDGARQEATERLHALAARSGVPAAQLRLSIPGGADPWMLIAQAEQEHDCDLVVIGKHGRNALQELLLGSTTRMVLAECTADVLVSTIRGD
ncbi:MAG TPA: universal stress protein [Ramlibacter sp.]